MSERLPTRLHELIVTGSRTEAPHFAKKLGGDRVNAVPVNNAWTIPIWFEGSITDEDVRRGISRKIRGYAPESANAFYVVYGKKEEEYLTQGLHEIAVQYSRIKEADEEESYEDVGIFADIETNYVGTFSQREAA